MNYSVRSIYPMLALSGLMLSCIALLLVSSGCSSSNEFRNNADVTVAYSVPRADVVAAYKDAFKTLPFISHEAHGDTLMIGASRDARFPADIQVKFSADGSMTIVNAAFQYDIIDSFYHYPMMLVTSVEKGLPKNVGELRPQVVYPSDSLRCDVSPPPADAVVAAPEVIGGTAALFRQLFYPPDAKKSGVEGVVYAAVVVGTRGKAVCVEIMSGLPAGLNGQVIGALLALDYTVGKVNGKPTPMRTEFPLTFRAKQL